MKKDPHNHERKYLGWKKRTKSGIPGISKANSDLMKRFLKDMEFGINVSVNSKKGSRSFIRLNTLRDKLMFFSKNFESELSLNCITDITEEQIHSFFADMRSGKIRKQDGSPYQSVGYFVKNFKAFWHWHMLVQNKEGKSIEDITRYLDSKVDKAKWVYLSEEMIRKLCNKAKYEYKVLIMFLFDSGIRSPTELVNVMVGDFYEDYKKLEIRDEASKTFGRKIKLLLCSDLIKEYVKDKKLKKDDYIFSIQPGVVNRYLKRLASNLFGNEGSLAGGKFSELTLYDFRHSSACYWLPRYKSESALKYRFGWKKSEMIHYYTELLGMKDTISEEDVILTASKTEIEMRLFKSEQERKILQDKIESMETQMRKIAQLTDILVLKTEKLKGGKLKIEH